MALYQQKLAQVEAVKLTGITSITLNGTVVLVEEGDYLVTDRSTMVQHIEKQLEFESKYDIVS